MQGRMAKGSKKELVIESPQQYRSLSEVEVDTVPQVAVSRSTAQVVSLDSSTFDSAVKYV